MLVGELTGSWWGWSIILTLTLRELALGLLIYCEGANPRSEGANSRSINFM